MPDDSQENIPSAKRVVPVELRKLSEERKTSIRAEVKENGVFSHANREVQDAYNADRRVEYAVKIALTESRAVNAYVKNPTPEHRQAQVTAAVKKHRDNRSPAKIDADRNADKIRKRESRKAKRAAEQKAMLEGKQQF